MFFADLHALGKVIEGSGLDTVAVKCVIYSAAAMRSTCNGKNWTRGEEYHIMNGLAISILKLEAALGPELPNDLKKKAIAFKEALHSDNPDMIDLYENR